MPVERMGRADGQPEDEDTQVLYTQSYPFILWLAPMSTTIQLPLQGSTCTYYSPTAAGGGKLNTYNYLFVFPSSDND